MKRGYLGAICYVSFKDDTSWCWVEGRNGGIWGVSQIPKHRTMNFSGSEAYNHSIGIPGSCCLVGYKDHYALL